MRPVGSLGISTSASTCSWGLLTVRCFLHLSLIPAQILPKVLLQPARRFPGALEDHSAPHTDMSFHMGADKREPAPGVIRADIVFDGATHTVEVCDTLDWRVPLEKAPQLVAALREEVDRIEERLQEFAGSSAEAQGVAA